MFSSKSNACLLKVKSNTIKIQGIKKKPGAGGADLTKVSLPILGVLCYSDNLNVSTNKIDFRYMATEIKHTQMHVIS